MKDVSREGVALYPLMNKMAMKKTKRNAYVLVEVLIAVSLLLMSGFIFFEVEREIARQLKRGINNCETERAYFLAMTQFVEELYEKKIPWESLSTNGNYTMQLKNTKDWTATCSFSLQHDDKLNPHRVLGVRVAIALQHPQFAPTLDLETEKYPPIFFCISQEK